MVMPFMSLYLHEHLHFTFNQTGFVMMAFGAGAVLGSVLGGKLADKIGNREVQVISLFLTALIFLLLLQLRDFNAIMVGFFFASIISEMLRPANIAMIASFSTDENRTRSYSLNRMAMNLGFAFGPTLGGFLAARNYEWIFWADAITCFFALGGMLYFFGLPQFSLKKSQNNKHEVKKLPQQSPLKDGYFLVILVISLFSIIAFFQFFFTIPVFFKTECKLDEFTVGWLLGLNGVIVFFLEMPLVFSLKKYANDTRVVALGTFLVGLGFLVVGFSKEIWGFVLGITILSIGEILWMPINMGIVSNRASKENLGMYIGWYAACFSVGHIIAPKLGLQLAEVYGFPYLLMLTFILCFFVSLAYLGLYFVTRASKKAV